MYMSVLCLDVNISTQNIAMVQYVFAHSEHEVKVAPHGNSLKTEGYVRTKPSVLTSLKELASESTAKRALSFVSSNAGGVVHAHSVSLYRAVGSKSMI